jgi:hypothetical protein
VTDDTHEAITAIAQAIAAAAKAGRWDEVERLRGDLRDLRMLLDPTYQSVTVPDVQAAKAEKWRNPPSLRELAAMLGCSQSFLSQAKVGLTRIRKSWADKIAEVHPAMPATRKTWPKGWAPEED